jgi:hypothetical protein
VTVRRAGSPDGMGGPRQLRILKTGCGPTGGDGCGNGHPWQYRSMHTGECPSGWLTIQSGMCTQSGGATPGSVKPVGGVTPGRRNGARDQRRTALSYRSRPGPTYRGLNGSLPIGVWGWRT